MDEQVVSPHVLAEQEEFSLIAEQVFKEGDEGTIAARQLTPVGARLLTEYKNAQIDRQETEDRWIKDLRQYRGLYDPDVEDAIGPNRSKAFVRKTRVKIKTVDARIFDLMFPANHERNWSIAPTPKPQISPEITKGIGQQLAQALQREPSDIELKKAVMDFTQKAADAMGATIDDQLADCRYRDVARSVIHSGHLYGTGILKSPLVDRKIRQRFALEDGKWQIVTEAYYTPFMDFVPLWRFYPDMAATNINECRFCFERHTMTRQEMAELAERRSFDGETIRDYINAHPEGETITPLHFEQHLMDVGLRHSANLHSRQGRYEILERWGWLNAEDLSACGVDVPQDRMQESFFSNVWLLPNGVVIKAVIQPINGVTWPYHFYYFDKDETSIFAEGIASIMRDDQEIINASARMMLDNGALSAGFQGEANMRLLSPLEDPQDVHPYKMWLRTGEEAGVPAVRFFSVPNNTGSYMEMFNLWENNADETTAIPRYMYGENATTGAAGTASGLSMLMSSASIVMKDLVASFDEGITKPFITGLYRWNMQFNPDNEIKGDYDIVARGTSSLMAKEVRAQQLQQFAATLQPEQRGFVKWDELTRSQAEAQEIGTILMSKDEIQAQQASPQFQQQQQMSQLQQQLQMAQMQASVAKMEAEVMRIRAEATNKNVEAAYAAIQAAGVVAENSKIAPVGDEILRSSGWQDQTPNQPIQGGVQPQQAQSEPPASQPPAQAIPPSAHVGEREGIETPEISA